MKISKLLFPLTLFALVIPTHFSNLIDKNNKEVVAEESQYLGWDFDDRFALTYEESKAVYTYLKPGSGVDYFYCVEKNDFNTWEFDFKFGQPTDLGNQTLWSGFSFQAGSEQTYLIIRRNGNVEASINGSKLIHDDFRYDFNRWYHIKTIFSDDYFKVYFDNDLFLESYDTGGMNFESAKVGFMCWGMRYAVKNTTFYSSEIIYPSTYRKIDFEFSKEISVQSCEAFNGELKFDQGNLVMDLKGDNPGIKFPKLDVAPGHRYSMYLPVRNTFLFRLENLSNADKIKIIFTNSTEEDKEYSKIFPIDPQSGFKSYFFNVSDVCQKGYLRNLRIQLIGASEGRIKINAITFEREDPIYEYCGEIFSCLANKETNKVTIKGKVDLNYINKDIVIYKSDAGNYNESLTYKYLKVLDTVKSDKNGNFESTFENIIPGEKTDLLACKFLVAVDGIKVSKAFKISNYEDFSPIDASNRFKVPEYTVNVLDFGAKGDAFTDDNQAFRNAIADLENHGGGHLHIPGDTTNPYGRRYVITQLDLCSNIQVDLDDGAILWQSSRDEELNLTVPIHERGFDTVTHGHDVDIDGLIWCHTFTTVNKPLIRIYKQENVRIKGNGSIRMCDTANEDADPYYYMGGVIDPVGLNSRTTQIPILIVYGTNVDLIDFTIMRSGSWHISTIRTNNMYIANIEEKEAVSVTSDGFGLCNAKNATIFRCMTYTSDDAVTFSCNVIEERFFAIAPMEKDDNYSTENVVVSSSYLWGGFGIVMIPWGTESPDQMKTGIRNIEITNCLLGGHQSSGSWPDDPFYGKSSYLTGYSTDGEDFNYVPITNVHYHNNIYLKPFNWSMGSVTPVATNLIVEDDVQGTIFSSSQFLNGDFDYKAHNGYGFVDEKDWTSGLSYWSFEGDVSTYKVGTKRSKYVDTGTTYTQDDYAGTIKNEGKLYQGLYEIFGSYRFQAKAKGLGGKTIFFVKDAVSGEVYYEEELDINGKWVNLDIPFYLPNSATIHIGFQHQGNNSIYIDDVYLEKVYDPDIYKVNGDKASIDSLDDFKIYYESNANIKFINGSLYTSGECEAKAIIRGFDNMKEFEFETEITCDNSKMDCGVYLFANNPSNNADKIDAYNVQIENETNSDTYKIHLFQFDSNDGYLGELCSGGARKFGDEKKVKLRIVFKNGILFVFVNDEIDPCLSIAIKNNPTGSIGLRSQFQSSQFSNISLTYVNYSNIENLNEAIMRADSIDCTKYTTESVDNLLSILFEAKALTINSSQSEIDMITSKLLAAIENLVEYETHDDSSENLSSSEIESSSDSSSSSESKEESSGCGGSLIFTNILISSFSLIGLSLLISKKKEKNETI